MADLNINATVPLEGLLMAVLNAITSITTTIRSTMSQENRDALDALHIRNLKRIDAILDRTVGTPP